MVWTWTDRAAVYEIQGDVGGGGGSVPPPFHISTHLRGTTPLNGLPIPPRMTREEMYGWMQ